MFHMSHIAFGWIHSGSACTGAHGMGWLMMDGNASTPTSRCFVRLRSVLIGLCSSIRPYTHERSTAVDREWAWLPQVSDSKRRENAGSNVFAGDAAMDVAPRNSIAVKQPPGGGSNISFGSSSEPTQAPTQSRRRPPGGSSSFIFG